MLISFNVMIKCLGYINYLIEILIKESGVKFF